MTSNKHLGANGHQLSSQLIAAISAKTKDDSGQYINVAGVGRDVSVAYEQLRNAAEYTQEHLLIQKAIRRFYVRNLSFQSNSTKNKKLIAKELITELIQSGYIENNSQPIEIIDQLGGSIHNHYSNYWRMKDSGIKPSVAHDWTLDLLSVESEKLITDDTIQTIFIQFAYRHYQSILKKESFVADDSINNFEASLYVAIYRSLFKADIPSVRYDMQRLYSVSDANIHDYSNFHTNIDNIYSSDLTDKITNYINKYGAPLRVLNNMIQSNEGVGELLTHSDRFHAAYSAQIDREYNEARRKLNTGLIKSIIFLLITKSIIGVAVEVPYDMFAIGYIVWVPLIINLLAPVVYMGLLRLGLKLPGSANTKAIQRYTDNMLYGDQNQVNLYPSVKKTSYPIGFSIAFILMFLLVFGLVTNLLIKLEFNIVQGAIFFIFFATANFLGFRLSRIVRELELVTAKSGLIMTLRDFLYMPFILLGQWLSEKYSKINIVALVLDTIIELPLKTILRLIRQWTEFINDKKDEI